jgi:hypothetical protein
MSIKKIVKLEEGYIIYTDQPLLNAEMAAIKNYLKGIAAEKIGLVFFRTAKEARG